MASSSACAGSCHREEESAQCIDDDRSGPLCRLLGCGRPVYRDADGPKEFCGRTHALRFLENRLHQAELTVCDFRDCQFPQARKADGGFHPFCSWGHAKKHASLKASITLSVSIPSLGEPQQQVPTSSSCPQEYSEPCEFEFEARLSLTAGDHNQARGICSASVANLSCKNGINQLEDSNQPESDLTIEDRPEQQVPSSNGPEELQDLACEIEEIGARLSAAATDDHAHDQSHGIHIAKFNLSESCGQHDHDSNWPELGVKEIQSDPDLTHNHDWQAQNPEVEATVPWNNIHDQASISSQQQLEQQREQLWNKILAAWPHDGFRLEQLKEVRIFPAVDVHTAHPWELMRAHVETGPILYFNIRRSKGQDLEQTLSSKSRRISRATREGGLTWRQSGKPDCRGSVTKRAFAYKAMSGKKSKDLPLVRIFTPECGTSTSAPGEQELLMEASENVISKKRKSREVEYRYLMTEYSTDSAVIYALRQNLSGFPCWPPPDDATSPSKADHHRPMAKSKVARTQAHATLESASDCPMACRQLQVRDFPDQPEGGGGGLVTSDIDAGPISVERLMQHLQEEPQSRHVAVDMCNNDDGHHAQCSGRTTQEETADAYNVFDDVFTDPQTLEGVPPVPTDTCFWELFD